MLHLSYFICHSFLSIILIVPVPCHLYVFSLASLHFTLYIYLYLSLSIFISISFPLPSSLPLPNSLMSMPPRSGCQQETPCVRCVRVLLINHGQRQVRDLNDRTARIAPVLPPSCRVLSSHLWSSADTHS